MSFYGAFHMGGLILAELGSAIVLSSCNATLREDAPGITPNIQTTVQTKDANPSLGIESLISQEDKTITLETLPRDNFDVDWVRAVKEGYINPKESIDTDSGKEILLNLDVVLRFNDPFIKDVLFSHATHTYWLNCESCHQKIFVPQVSANKMTMQDIREGKYCGKCHGVVAFPANIMPGSHFRDNCLKCHNYEKH